MFDLDLSPLTPMRDAVDHIQRSNSRRQTYRWFRWFGVDPASISLLRPPVMSRPFDDHFQHANKACFSVYTVALAAKTEQGKVVNRQPLYTHKSIGE